MLYHTPDHSRAAKTVTYRASMPASVTVRQWVIYHLLAARTPRGRGAVALPPPQYRDLLQARITDMAEPAR